MKSYELMLIFDPSLEESKITEELSKITSIIEKNKGEILSKDTWGIKKLAYPIKRQENGYYILLYFNSDSKVLLELDRLNKINDKILRHLIVKGNGKN